MNRNRLLIVALVLMSMLVWYAAAEACPGSRMLKRGRGRSGIVRGYMLSIIFMLSMPFLIFGSFGTYVYLHVRRTRLAAEQAAAQTAANPQAELEARELANV